MKIEQRCQLYIDFETKTEEKKQEMAAYFKRYFKYILFISPCKKP